MPRKSGIDIFGNADVLTARAVKTSVTRAVVTILSYRLSCFAPLTYTDQRADFWGRGFIMWPTRDDAVVMYARFCEARYGVSAYGKVRWQATQLALQGDLSGEKIWNEVAEEIKNKVGVSALQHAEA